MSIDRQLALRNNMSPQQLMQRYSVSNELLDLLALQKMQSEIAAKKRDQMAQMAQQPGTIKEQKEREVFQAVREEVAPMAQRAQQVTAAEQQKQLQQQRAMQMLAQSMQRQGAPGALNPASAQPAPMMSGIATAPAPNMRMAQGGIVGYAEGDLVENEEDPMMLTEALFGSPLEQRGLLARELDRQIEELGGSQRGRIGSTRALPQEAQERIARINELERDKLRLLAAGNDPQKVQQAVSAVAGRRPYSARPVGEMAERALPAGREGRSSEDIASMIETAMGVRQAPQLAPTMEMQEPRRVQDMGGAGVLLPPGAQTVASSAPASTSSPGGFFSPSGPGSALAGGTRSGPSASAGSSSGAVAPGVVTRGPLAGLPQLEANTNVYATPEVSAATRRLRTAEGNLQGAYSASPKEERVSARDEAAKFLRREQMRQAEEARIAELRRAMARTPEELERERQKGFLLGAANRGKGYVGAGASAGLQAVLDAQRAERIGNLEKLQGLARDMETRDIGIGTEGLKSGRTAEEQAALGLRGLLSAASDEQSAVMRAASDMADLKFRQDEANQEAYIEAAKAAYDSAQDALQNATDNLERLQAERDRMDSEVAAVREALVASQGYGRAVNTLQAGQPVIIGGQEFTSEIELAAYYNQMAVDLVNKAMGGGNRYQEARRALDQAIDRLRGNIGMPTPGLPSGVSTVTPAGR